MKKSRSKAEGLHLRKKSLSLIGGLSTLSLVVTLLVAPVAVSAAAATTSGQLVSEASNRDLASSLALSDFGSGASSAIIAEDSEIAVLLAASRASRMGVPLLIAPSGTSLGANMSTLQTLGVDEVSLVSTSIGYFQSAFISALSSISVNVATQWSSTDLLSLSADLLGTISPEYVMARSDDSDAITLATSYAFSRDLPLLIWQTSTTDSLFSSVTSSLNSARITIFAHEGNVPTYAVSSAQTSNFALAITNNPSDVTVQIAGLVEGGGARLDKVVVAPKDSLSSLAIAGMHARAEDGFLLPAGAHASLTVDSRAREFLELMRDETRELSLIGIGLTPADLAAVLTPTAILPTPAPVLRVTGLDKTPSGYDIVVNAVSGATSYSVYDWDSSLVGVSSTTTISLTNMPSSVIIVVDGAGGELARIDVRVNEYADAIQRSSALVSSIGSGSVHLVFLGETDTPRLISRTETDPFDPMGPYNPPVNVAITCSKTFSESSLDPTKEFEYIVTELTNVDSATCDDASPISTDTVEPIVVMGTTVPPTQYPWEASQQSFSPGKGTMSTEEALPRPRVPHMTRTDMLLHGSLELVTSSKDKSLSKGMTQMGAGDSMPDILVRYMAFIPEAAVPFPGFTGDLAKPYMYFSGDNHAGDQSWGSYRFFQEIHFSYGSDHTAPSYSEGMGTTHQIKCGVNIFSFSASCSEMASATAPLSELSMSSPSHTATRGEATLTAAATIPLVSGAPAIDTLMTFSIGTTSRTMYGYHDLMPKHEVYLGIPYSEYWRVYDSPYTGFLQLPCLFSSPTARIPGCYALVNRSI